MSFVLVAGTVDVRPNLASAVYGSEFVPAAGLVRWIALSLLIPTAMSPATRNDPLRRSS